MGGGLRGSARPDKHKPHAVSPNIFRLVVVAVHGVLGICYLIHCFIWLVNSRIRSHNQPGNEEEEESGRG